MLFPIIVYEYFDGPMLQSHYVNPRYNNGFNMDDFYPLAMQLSLTLAAIHTQQIIHRDLTSANILYNPNTNTVKIIDFGLSTPFPSNINNNQTKHIPKQLQGTLNCTQQFKQKQKQNTHTLTYTHIHSTILLFASF